MEKLLHSGLMKLNIKKHLNKNTSNKKSPEVIRDFFSRSKTKINYFKLVAKNLSKSAPLKSLATIVPLGSIKKLAGILCIPN